MHVFIVRPFGIKNGIDFDRVELDLIRPAFEKAGFSGGTTGEFIEQGNIRTDMFEQLLIADIVIADVSIHNANAFYELGIRHALRDKRTFLIRSKGDEIPFDLKTDRYFAYDAQNPGASVQDLKDALKRTWDSQKQDSPVFQLLPALEAADRNKFLMLPLDFREDVERAESEKRCGDLQLFSAEIDGLAWKTMGLRLIGAAQFKLNDLKGAKVTWEAVREYDDMDLEANKVLGTVYQRLGQLVRSDQALSRALGHRNIASRDLAEIRALMARNAKTRWEDDWRGSAELRQAQRAALASPDLKTSFECYCRGFLEDRNHFYSGLNALAMVTIITELAAAHRDLWQECFDSDEDATQKLRKLQELRSDLAVGVRLGIESKRTALERQEKADIWTEISAADLVFLTSTQPNRVARAYKTALDNASDFAREAARSQLLIYERLGVFTEKTQAALNNIPAPEQAEGTLQAAPRVILFTGHRIDAEGREKPRFPPHKEDRARAMIAEAVSQEREKTKGNLLGIAGGASGGDILFHEVCGDLKISTQMYLVVPKNDYIKASVADSGPNWVERFNRLLQLREPAVLSESDELPRWLRTKKGYNIWQRSNLWMLHDALAISKDNIALVALWDGEAGDAAGGTEDMVKRAQDRGATFIHLNAKKLIG